MRQTRLLIFGLVLMLCCGPMAAAEESSWGWLWPFGQEKPAEQPYPTTDQPTPRPVARTPDRAALRQKPGRHPVGKTEPLFPNFELRKFWPGKSEVDEARNAWTEPQAAPESTSPWQVVTESTQRLGESTREAWDKTVNVLTPEYLKSDNRPAPHVAQRPPLWKRAFGLGEEEPQGPQTVTEWMAQERLNP